MQKIKCFGPIQEQQQTNHFNLRQKHFLIVIIINNLSQQL
jgi:hypothetical protein